MAIFDTDVLIDVLRGTAGAKEAVLKHAGPNNLISAITYGEILFVMRACEDEATMEFLSVFKIIEVNAGIVETALDVKRKAKGHKLELYDCIIAATAIMTGMPLITGNKKHYPDKRLKVITPEYRAM
jgi:predicted nucleic acid-binding protein